MNTTGIDGRTLPEHPEPTSNPAAALPAPASPHSRPWVLIALALIAVILRIGLAAGGDLPRAFDPNGDSSSYIALADGLRHGCGFAKLIDGRCAPPEVNRTPGYPLFLELCSNLRIALVVQAFLCGLVVFATGSFVFLHWGIVAATVASFLLAIDIPGIVYSAELMSETLFTACFTLAILLALYTFDTCRCAKSQLLLLLGSAGLLSQAILTRPIGEFGLIIPAILVLLVGSDSWPRKLALQFLLVSLPLLTLLLWSVRNAAAGIATFSSIAATNLFYYRAGGALAFSSGSGWLEALNKMGSHPQAQLTADAITIILQHPVAFAAMTAWSFVFLAIVPLRTPLYHVLGLQQSFAVQEPGAIRLRDTLATLASSPRAALASVYRNEFASSLTLVSLMIVQVLSLAILWVGVIAGLTSATIHSYRGKCILIFAGSALIFLLLASGPEATARMRLPAMPFLAILAGIGWARIATKLKLLPARSNFAPSSEAEALRI